MRVVCVALLAVAGNAENMNGRYMVASGDRFDVPFNDDYASKGHEYFDVWAPEMATHYGEVFWTNQGNQPLPQEIVERFKGKVMAITGYEQDQVMVTPTGKPGLNPEKDVSVPINWAYNHHYMAWMTGEHSEMKMVDADINDVSAHGSPMKMVAIEQDTAAFRADTRIPTSQMFSEGNGGESRKSFHGYPDGFAQLIESPDKWHITPMQIDTRNRDCGVTPESVNNCTPSNFGFIPGIEPKQARYGRKAEKGTNYSGVLECPCNSRYGGDPWFYPDAQTKLLEHNYMAVSNGNCGPGKIVHTEKTCFEVAPTIGIHAKHFLNKTVADPKLPPACSVVAEKDGTATVYFNTAGNGTCKSSTKKSGEVTTEVGVTFGLALQGLPASSTFLHLGKGKYCQNNHIGLIKAFAPKTSSVADETAAMKACEQYCSTDEKCWGCSVDCVPARSANAATGGCGTGKQGNWNAITSCGQFMHWQGLLDGDVSEKRMGGNATITLSGPSDVWFGIGINASNMADSPYTFVCNSSGVIEQKIGTCGSEAEHCAGDLLKSSVTVVSNTVKNRVRTIVLTRPFQGITDKHYSFDLVTDSSINVITAVGNSQVFAYHKAHAAGTVAVVALGDSTCVCDLGSTGKLCETNGTKCGSFTKNCVGPPAGSLKEQDNPTCSSRTYAGGLRCCGHKRIMLDADQEIRPELLRYHMKWRFWFQEYKPANKTMTKDGSALVTSKPSHYNLPRIYYQTEANAGEYDIQPAFRKPGEQIVGYPGWPLNTPTPGTTCTGTCPDGPDCECVHTIHYKWTVSNIRLIYAGGHCHAPACKSIELYRNDTGELLCRQLPYYGKGNVTHDKYDESGYLSLPPCLWGDEKGLDAPVWLPKNTPLLSIKKNFNTHRGHYGEMASWQMRGVNFPADGTLAESSGLFI